MEKRLLFDLQYHQVFYIKNDVVSYYITIPKKAESTNISFEFKSKMDNYNFGCACCFNILWIYGFHNAGLCLRLRQYVIGVARISFKVACKCIWHIWNTGTVQRKCRNADFNGECVNGYSMFKMYDLRSF